VLAATAYEYGVALAATGGQSAGFLVNEIAPLVKVDREVLSEIRSPIVTLNTLDRWASDWASDCFMIDQAPDFSEFKADRLELAHYSQVAALGAARATSRALINRLETFKIRQEFRPLQRFRFIPLEF
jgi:hypothetical protein